MGWFNRKRKAADLVTELETADHTGPSREFPWGMVALWALKLFLWLLAKYPNLIHVALDKFEEFAGKQGEHERHSTKAAVNLLRANVRDYPATFKMVMEQ